MKKVLLLIIFCVFSLSLFSETLEGRWKTGELIIKIRKYENDNSKYKIIVYQDGNAYTYVESKRVLTWDNGSQKKYKLYASSTSYSSDLPKNMEISFAETSKPTEIFGMSLGSNSYFVKRIDDQRTSSAQTHSLRDSIKEYNEKKGIQTTNQTNTTQNNTQNTNTAQETRIQNINATYGYKGVWLYEFTNYGTFRDHNCTYNEYGRVVRENGSLSGTYYLTKDSNGTIRVYLRYDNGRQKQGYIRYKNHTSEFSLDRKTSWEM